VAVGAPTDSDPKPRRRLARAAHELRPDASFTRAKRAVLAGQVTVDGIVVRDPGAWVGAGAAIEWNEAGAAVAGQVVIVTADDALVVAIKPAGLLTVPTPERERDTMITRLALAVRRKSGRRPYLGVVHRLDRDTSGLVAFGANRRAQAALQRQLLERSMGRFYEAWVAGDLRGEAGTFDRELIGDGVRRRRWVARPGERGKPAVTHWSVISRHGIATRVRVALETGRTHQIRIHFAAAGHPVLGEPVYRAPGVVMPALPVARQALHAAELVLDHPHDGRRLRFAAPLPADLEALVAALGGGA